MRMEGEGGKEGEGERGGRGREREREIKKLVKKAYHSVKVGLRVQTCCYPVMRAGHCQVVETPVSVPVMERERRTGARWTVLTS